MNDISDEFVQRGLAAVVYTVVFLAVLQSQDSLREVRHDSLYRGFEQMISQNSHYSSPVTSSQFKKFL